MGFTPLVVGPIVGLDVLTATNTVLFDGPVHAINVIIVFLAGSPAEIAWRVIRLTAVYVINLGLAFRWESIERSTDDLMDFVVFATELDLAIAIAVGGTECPAEPFEVITSRWHQDSAVFPTIQFSNRILFDLHLNLIEISIYTRDGPSEEEPPYL